MAARRQIRSMHGLVILLCILSVVTLSYRPLYFAHAPLGDELIVSDRNFSNEAHWTVIGQGDILGTGVGTELSPSGSSSNFRLKQDIVFVDTQAYFRVEAVAGPVRVHRVGDQSWQIPRLLAYSYNANDGPDWSQPHTLVEFRKGQPDQQTFSGIVRPRPGHDRLTVEASFIATDGTITLQAFSVRPYIWISPFILAEWLLLLAWMVFAFSLVVRLARQGGPKAVTAMIAVAPLVSLFLIPSAAIQTAVHAFAPTLSPHQDVVGWLSHSLVFVMIGAYLRVIFANDKLSTIILIICVLALASEAIQQFVETRIPSFEDIIFDLAGGLAGLYATHRLMIWGKGRHAANRH